MDLITAVIAFVAALLGGGGIAAILDHRNKNKLADSQVKSSDMDRACKLIEKLELRVERLTTRVKYLEDELEERDLRITAIKNEYEARFSAFKSQANERIDELEAELAELREWIKAKGMIPPPRRRSKPKAADTSTLP